MTTTEEETETFSDEDEITCYSKLENRISNISYIGYGFDFEESLYTPLNIKSRILDIQEILPRFSTNMDFTLKTDKYYQVFKTSSRLSTTGIEAKLGVSEVSINFGAGKVDGETNETMSIIKISDMKNVQHNHEVKWDTIKDIKDMFRKNVGEDFENLDPRRTVEKYGTHLICGMLYGYRKMTVTQYSSIKDLLSSKRSLSIGVEGTPIPSGSKAHHSQQNMGNYDEVNCSKIERFFGPESETDNVFKSGEITEKDDDCTYWPISVNSSTLIPIWEFVDDETKKKELKKACEKRLMTIFGAKMVTISGNYTTTGSCKSFNLILQNESENRSRKIRCHGKSNSIDFSLDFEPEKIGIVEIEQNSGVIPINLKSVKIEIEMTVWNSERKAFVGTIYDINKPGEEFKDLSWDIIT